jgi:hypothetical protein
LPAAGGFVFVGPKTPEKLAIRMGRCCLFSIVCIRF